MAIASPARPRAEHRQDLTEHNLRRLAGLTGLAAAVLVLSELPLYVAYSAPTPDSKVLTRSLFGFLGLASMTSLAVFMVSLRPLLSKAGFAGLLAPVAGIMWVVVELVSTGLETGAVIAAPQPIDPTIAASGISILYGSSTRLIEALFLIGFGVAVSRLALLPRWASISAYVLAGINLFFVPSFYFGNDPSNFYAANGWGTTASMGGVLMIWMLCIGVAMLCKRSS
ncbi:hypothetical protein [Fodinicola acaciae]|uniref:hypothetical protein n=1 Tax=Fodinicola acaciae TaxID=2681555 RepID=UPI0013D59940|nr:hypothetical protein [Fodinicola acaciae]